MMIERDARPSRAANMRGPAPPPHVVRDAQGRVRLKLKRGVGDEHSPLGPHVHYFGSSGARIDSTGRALEARARQNFRPIRWDLPEEASPRVTEPPDVELALGVLRRSPTFAKLLDQALRAGWVLEVATPAFGAGPRTATRTISLDASKRSAFVARLARDVALACAKETPFPWQPTSASSFVHAATMAWMRLWAEAAIAQARIRDEILVAGGPDIGGPGLRGMQVEAYDIAVRQTVPHERLIDAIAFSVDGELAERFKPQTGPHLATTIADAFLPPKTLVVGSLSAEMLQVLDAVRALPALDPFHVSRLFGVTLAPRPLAVETTFVDAQAALVPHGPFSWVELRAPAPGVTHLRARLLLVPRYEMSHFDLHAWYGLGAPWDIDLGAGGTGTVVYPDERRPTYVTYRVDQQRSLRLFAFQDA
jgi:hypothetical protein